MSDLSIVDKLKKCGYISATPSYKFFSLQCLYCKDKFGRWATFIKHLKESHNPIEDDCLNLSEDEGDDNLSISVDSSGYQENDIQETTLRNETVNESRDPKSADINKNLDMDVNSTTGDALPRETNISEYEKFSNGNSEHIQITEQLLVFIELYKQHPRLWNAIDQRSAEWHDAQHALVTDLKNKKIYVSVEIVLKVIKYLHLHFYNISLKINSNMSISASELRLYNLCFFLSKDHTDDVESLIPTDKEVDDVIAEIEAQIFAEQNKSELIDINYCDLITSEDEYKKKIVGADKFHLNILQHNELTLYFIHCLKKFPSLWSNNYSEYGKSNQHQSDANEIKQLFAFKYCIALTEDDLFQSIKHLQKFEEKFRNCTRKMSQTQRMFYDKCSFLREKLTGATIVPDIEKAQKLILFGGSDKCTLALIDACQNYPILWDPKHKNYSIYTERRKAYDVVCQILQKTLKVDFSKDDIYDGIYKLKNYYYLIKEKDLLNKPLAKRDLLYLDKCKFFPPKINIDTTCHICNQKMRNENSLKVHLLKSHNVGELPWKCEYCDDRFAKRTDVRNHEICVHTKEYTNVCKYCNKGFPNRLDVERHELVHSGEKNAICEQCGMSFRLKQQLAEHVRVVHQKLRLFKCTMCPKDYTRKRLLDDHIRSHLNIRDKICSHCGKAFTSMNLLAIHRQIHNKEKKHCCKICAERFHQLVGLKAHMKRKHSTVK